MRAVVALASALILMSCTAFVRPPDRYGENAADRIERVFEGVVGLVGSTGRAYCSGAWIDSSHVLTAAHCVVDDDGVTSPTVAVGVWGDYDLETNVWRRTYAFDVLAADTELDLALLRFSSNFLPPAHVSFPILERSTVRGEQIWAFGHPWGVGYYFSIGEVVHPRRTFTNAAKEWTQHSAPTYPGMSGGPVLVRDGSLACITSFGWEDHMTGCIHRNSISNFLKRRGMAP